MFVLPSLFAMVFHQPINYIRIQAEKDYTALLFMNRDLIMAYENNH